MTFDFFFPVILVAKNNDLVPHRPFARGRPVQDDFAAPPFAGHRIGHEPLSVIEIRTDDSLIRKNARCLHQILIDRETAFIFETGFGHRGPMYLRPQHLSEHCNLVSVHYRSSIIFGTTKYPWADSGAFARACSTDREGRTSSGRNTLTCPNTVAVGSTSAVSYCFNVSTYVRIWLSCFVNAVFSTSVNSNRASFATFSTSCLVISMIYLSPTFFQDAQNGHPARPQGVR